MEVLRAGTVDQQVLARSGDNLRIDWGYVYLAAPAQKGLRTRITSARARDEFVSSGTLGDADELDVPPASRYHPVLAAAFDLGSVSAEPVSRHVMLAYDDLFSLQYFQRNLRPWWRRGGGGAAAPAQPGQAQFVTVGAAPAGTYRVVLLVGGREYEQLALIVPDPGK
mgnify:CR=1 FL=1